MKQVTITNGIYRGDKIEGTFELVEGFRVMPSGKKVVNVKAVEGMKMAFGGNCRVQVQSKEDVVYLCAEGEVIQATAINEDGTDAGVIAEYTATETDEEAIQRIRRTFEIVEEMSEAATSQIIRGMIIAGPPGIGKSHGVEQVIDRYRMSSELRGVEDPCGVLKGSASGIGLYQFLYKYSSKGQICVFDDADTILFDEDCLNLLKAAMDTTAKRTLSWQTESKALENADIPKTFNFEGSIIFLTNVSFDKVKGRTGDHLKAILSRCHYLDMEMDSERDKLLRIQQVVGDGMLRNFGFEQHQEEEIVQFILSNAQYLREISLRMVKKVADLYKAMPASWEEKAELTCLAREAKFARMLAHKKNIVSV